MCTHFQIKVSKPGITIQNLAEIFFFSLSFLRYCFRVIALKMLILQSFLPLKEPLLVTFKKTSSPYSKNYVAQQALIMTNLLKPLEFLRSHSSGLFLEK